MAAGPRTMDHRLIEMSLIQDDRVVLVRMPGLTMRPDKGNPHLNVLSMANC